MQWLPLERGTRALAALVLAGASAKGQACRPVLFEGGGEPWQAWLEFDQGRGFQVRAARAGADDVRELTDFGAVLELAGGQGPEREPLVVWSQAAELEGEHDFELFCAVFAGGSWSEPERLTRSRGSDLAPALASSAGRACLVWERSGRELWTRELTHRGWSEPERLRRAAALADPAVACGPDACWVAWSELVDGRYRLHAARWGEPRSSLYLDSGSSGYALHPALAAAPDGRFWAAWDRVEIARHGHSAPPGGQDLDPERAALARVRLRAFRSVPASETGGEARVELFGLPPAPARLRGDLALELAGHSAFPVLACDGQGNPVLAARTLRELHGDRAFGFGLQVVRWTQAETHDLLRSSALGPLEPAALACVADTLWCAFTDDQRAQALSARELDRERFPLASRRFLAPLGMGGRIELAPVPASGPAGRPGASAPLVALGPAQPAPERAGFASGEREREGEYQLWRGDLHKHSVLSRCSAGREPEAETYLRYARDRLGCDVFALTDHVEQLTPLDWRRLALLAQAYSEPGRFVVLHGFEWTHPSGHRHVLSHQPLPWRGRAFESDLELSAAFAPLDPLVTAHHSADGEQPAPPPQPRGTSAGLIEIFQAARGSFEAQGAPRIGPKASARGAFVLDWLEAGHELGFTASSDHGYASAYTGLWSRGGSREAFVEALRARRTFAATSLGTRLWVAALGQPMGSRLEPGASPLELEIRVAGPSPLASVELVRSRGRAERLAFEAGASSAQILWREEWPEPGATWSYVRASFEDGELLWSSPIFVRRP
jgi:hypothetical protein